MCIIPGSIELIQDALTGHVGVDLTLDRDLPKHALADFSQRGSTAVRTLVIGWLAQDAAEAN